MNAPIVIYRSVTRDGETFALDAASRDRLSQHFGELARFHSRVFIGNETRADYEAIHASIVPQVVQLLTGLALDRLQELGGVVFRDPVTEREIQQSSAA